MQAKTFKKETLDVLGKVIAKPSKCTLPLFENILIREDGTFTVYNINENTQLSLKTKIKEVSGFINFAQLNKIITKLKLKEFTIIKPGENFIIKSGKLEFKIKESNFGIDDWIETPRIDKVIGHITPGTVPIIKKAVRYTSDDELRPSMNHVQLTEDNHVVGSDSHRLCYFKCKDTLEDSILLPKSVCNTIEETDYEVYRLGSDYKLISDTMVISWKFDGHYPNWKAVVPEATTNVTIDKKQLMESIDCALLTANPESKMCYFSFTKNPAQKKGVFKINSRDLDAECSFSEILTTYQCKLDPGYRIGFKGTFLLDILKYEGCEDVNLCLGDNNRAMTINDHVILMPMMVDDI